MKHKKYIFVIILYFFHYLKMAERQYRYSLVESAETLIPNHKTQPKFPVTSSISNPFLPLLRLLLLIRSLCHPRLSFLSLLAPSLGGRSFLS